MDVKKVLFVSQEIDPYIAATPMGVFGRQLAQGLQERGAEVRSFMPKYGIINERRNQLHEVIRLSGLNIVIDDTDHPLIIKVATLQPSRLQVYFIDNDDYFFRKAGNENLETIIDSAFNDERAIFFVRGTIETVRKLRWEPGIIQCTGWLTALIPLYIKLIYNEDPTFRTGKVVYSLFDTSFEGTLDDRMAEKLLQENFSAEQVSNFTNSEGKIDYMALNRLAIDYSDAIIESSANIPEELVAYAKASGKPFLPYEQAKEGAQSYYNFYSSL